MRIRQVALAASDLEKTDEIFRRLLGCDESYADPEIIYFVSIIGSTLSGIAFSRWSARLSQIQPRVVFLIAGVAMVATWSLSSREPHSGAGPFGRYVDTYGISDDRGNAKAIHLHPKDVPGAIPSIDEMTPPESWLWAGEAGNKGQEARRPHTGGRNKIARPP